MEILTSIQKYEEYIKLRKQELSVKNLLKKTITQIKEELEKVDGFLPKIPMEERAEEEGIITPQMLPRLGLIKAPKAKRDLLEEQIDEIQRKISMLS